MNESTDNNCDETTALINELEDMRKMCDKLLTNDDFLELSQGDTDPQSFFSNEINLLKEQISFLAKRILLLHDSQEDLREQVRCLKENAAENQRCVDSEKLSLHDEPKLHKNNVTQSLDSGCNVSGNSSTYPHQNNLANDDTLSADALSDIVGRSHGKTVVTDERLLKQLIQAENNFGWELNYIRSRLCVTKEPERSSKTKFENVRKHHSAYLEALVRFIEKTEFGYATSTDDIFYSIKLYWTEEDVIDTYLTFLRAYREPAARLSEKNLHTEKDRISIQNFYGILWRHLHHSKAYFMGIRDAASSRNRHLDEIISAISFMLKVQQDYLLEGTYNLDPPNRTPEEPEYRANEFRIGFTECTSIEIPISLPEFETPGKFCTGNKETYELRADYSFSRTEAKTEIYSWFSPNKAMQTRLK